MLKKVCLALLLAAAPQPLSVAGPERPAIELRPLVASGLRHPVYLSEPPDRSGRLFVLEQPGRIRIIRNGQLLAAPFLNITQRVRSSGEEQGLLGMAAHPDYARNGRYVVNYTRSPDGATVIAEYHASDKPDVSDTVERALLVIPHPYANHNGGMLEFGPDRLLYIGTGDGGSRGDPDNRGQNVNDLLGKMLRIDVDGGRPYAIPGENPFAQGGGRPEIFAYGLRNPWRFSFDRDTGELWAGDVGQNDWEEIDVVTRGGNYGWSIMEGAHCFKPKQGCRREGLILPIAEYATRSPRCSIIGGYVYRGASIPALRGTYVYGDYCSGEVMGLTRGDQQVQQVLLQTGLRISSFGQTRAGELYLIDLDGGLYLIAPAAQSLPTTR